MTIKKEIIAIHKQIQEIKEVRRQLEQEIKEIEDQYTVRQAQSIVREWGTKYGF